MPALFQEEALKAQAVAARSYAVSKMENDTISIRSTVLDQVFLTEEEMKELWKDDFQLYYERISNIVKETAGEVVKRDGNVLKTYYFSMSNGYTQDSELVFGVTGFTSTESRWDNHSLRNFEVETIFEVEMLISLLGLTSKSLSIDEITRTKTNHVEKIVINNQTFPGTNFRHALGIRSTDFDIKKEDNGYKIITRGFGHGVGMSQHGANGMAKDGYNYREILKHYYKNIEIKKI